MSQQRIYLFFISFSAILGGFLFGFDTAVISGTIPFVKTQFSLNAIQEGWFVSSALVGCFIGVAFSGPASDYWGRKPALIASALLFLVSALGCTFSVSHFALISYRLVGGLGIGIASMLAPLYLSEMAPPQIRGRLVSLYQFAITIGILLAYFSNAWVLNASEASHGDPSGIWGWIYQREIWRGMFGNEIYPATLYLLLLFFIPRSARWLLDKGREQEAYEVMAQVLPAQELEHEFALARQSKEQPKVPFRDLFRPGLRRPMQIALFLMVFSQVCGINAIIYYGPTILNQAGFALGDALGGQVSIGIINVLFTVLAIWQVDKWGRKPLLLLGIAGVWASLLTLGFLFHFEVTGGNWIITFILLFIACYAFSLGPVQWIVASEIFPTHIRGRAMAISIFALWVANAVIGQVFPWMLANFGSAGAFWTFALLTFPAFFVVLYLVPETKGKSLEEIQGYWSKE